MHLFKDREGKDWAIDVNVGALKRIKQLLDVDLMALISEPEFIDGLIGNPIQLVDILYVLCRTQAESANISDEQFGGRMAGDSLDSATTALLEDFVDFFPSRKREILKTVLAKLKTIEARVLTLAETAINSPEVDAAIEGAFKTLGSLSLSTPQLSDETPTASLSAS